MNLAPPDTDPSVETSALETPAPEPPEEDSSNPENFDFILSAALEALTRISVGLPVDDPETGLPYPPVKRTQAELDALRRAYDAETELLHAQVQLHLERVKTNIAKLDVATARAHARRRSGYLEYFFPWL